jgi:hypothetical protein
VRCLVGIAVAADALPPALRGLDCADDLHHAILFGPVAGELARELFQHAVQLRGVSQ